MHKDHSDPVVDNSKEDDLKNLDTKSDVSQLKTTPKPHSHGCGDASCHVDHDEASWVKPQRPYAPKIGRNDPCLCGSGKKYKKCCLGSAVASH